MSAAVVQTRSILARHWRAFAALVAATIAGAACAPGGSPPSFPVVAATGLRVQVVDSLYDAGRSPSVALDKNGNPEVAYLLYQPVLKKGDLPPPIVGGAPQPPSVMQAAYSGGTWTRVPASGGVSLGQSEAGKATAIANKDGQAIPGVNDAMTLDAAGKHHIVWATPSGLFYTDDSNGTYGSPTKISSAQTFGASIAVAPDGTSWIAYYEGSTVKVASGSGSTFTEEQVATTSGAPGATAGVTAIGAGSSGPQVAYGDNGTTVVASKVGNAWTPTPITGPGGYGLSMALDKSGNPNLAYYDQSGNVYEVGLNGGGQTKLATVEPAKGTAGPSAGWSTGIAVDGSGVDYVAWSDIGRGLVYVATNGSGSFQTHPVQGSFGGLNPSIAVSADAQHLAVAWYDGPDGDLDIATPPAGSLALAFSPAPVVLPSAGPTAPQCSPGSSTDLSIAAPVGAAAKGFDTTCLAVAAGKTFTVTFANDDTGVPHDWALFANSAATSPIGGATSPTPVSPGSSQKYSLTALKAGTYFYHCDFHQTTMTGTLVVK